MGYLNFDEPFKSLVHQGVILGTDGFRMSKSKGNVIAPDPYVEQYGSDVLRLYLMFGFSYTEGGPWSDDGIKAVIKFLERIERLSEKIFNTEYEEKSSIDKDEKELLYTVNYTIKSVDNDMDSFSFNTAVARLMELLNAISKYEQSSSAKNLKVLKDAYTTLILLLAPCAPHFAEEIWENLGNKPSIFNQEYPVCDEKALVKDEVEVVIQINSKIKAKALIPNGASEDFIRELIKENQKISDEIGDKTIKKLIIIPNRLINIIV